MEEKGKGINIGRILLDVALFIIGVAIGYLLIHFVSGEKMSTEVSIFDKKVDEAVTVLDKTGISKDTLYTNYDSNNVSTRDAIIAGISNLDQINVNDCIKSNSEMTKNVGIDEFNEAVKKAGINKKVTLDDFSKNAKDNKIAIGDYGYGFYKVTIQDSNIYAIKGCPEEITEVTDVKATRERVEISGNNLYLYQKVAFDKIVQTKDGSGHVSHEYYKDSERKNKIETMSDIQSPTWSKYNTVKFTFKKEKKSYKLIKSETISG